jgi:SAM-dependent methyltransferase
MWCCPSCGNFADFADAQNPWPADWRCPTCGCAVERRDGITCLAPTLIEACTGFDPKLFELLARSEETSFWFCNRARLIVELVRRYSATAQTMLEVGCGTGSVLSALKCTFPELRLTGSDLHPQGLAYARARLDSNVLLLQMDARRIPARSAFDVVGAFDVVEHIVEDELVFAELFAALKPGGVAVIAVPQHPWLWSPEDEMALHVRRYACGELETKLERAGFHIRHSTSFNALLLPLMIASRLATTLRARMGTRPAPLEELQMAGWVNRALSSVLQLELKLTIAGARWPFGGSRIVVAARP